MMTWRYILLDHNGDVSKNQSFLHLSCVTFPHWSIYEKEGYRS